MTQLSVITGSSRGMGEAIALQCLAAGHQVIGIARQTSQALDAAAARHGATLAQWPADLADASAVAQRLQAWLADTPQGRFGSATLINNAGVIAPLRPLGAIPLEDTVRALRVGLEASMLLTSAFLAGTATWPGRRQVLNISSGLGRRAMAGSASYCAAKAGMDHFSRCVALEEAGRPNPARIVSLAPGVIATDMQGQLRAADPAAFPDHATFVQLQASGQLMSPDEAARKVLAVLARPDFGEDVVSDVRSLA